MNYEDLHACRWARRFEQHFESRLDVCGLLRARDFQNAWIHPLKDMDVFVEDVVMSYYVIDCHHVNAVVNVSNWKYQRFFFF